MMHRTRLCQFGMNGGGLDEVPTASQFNEYGGGGCEGGEEVPCLHQGGSMNDQQSQVCTTPKGQSRNNVIPIHKAINDASVKGCQVGTHDAGCSKGVAMDVAFLLVTPSINVGHAFGILLKKLHD